MSARLLRLVRVSGCSGPSNRVLASRTARCSAAASSGHPRSARPGPRPQTAWFSSRCSPSGVLPGELRDRPPVRPLQPRYQPQQVRLRPQPRLRFKNAGATTRANIASNRSSHPGRSIFPTLGTTAAPRARRCHFPNVPHSSNVRSASGDRAPRQDGVFAPLAFPTCCRAKGRSGEPLRCCCAFRSKRQHLRKTGR